MSDGAAGAAAPAGATTTGPQTPGAVAPSTNGASGAEKPVAPRANDGRFLPKASNVNPPVKPAAEVEAKEPAKDPYRFKRKVKVYGEEQEVDLSEDDLTREIQIGRALRKQAADLKRGREATERLIQLAKEDPEAFLAEAGHDAEEFARKRLAHRAKLETMEPHERRAYELEAEVRQLRAESEQRQKSEAQAAKEAQHQRAREANVARYTEALKVAGLPATSETLYEMALAERVAWDDAEERGLPAPDFTPQELAQETIRRLNDSSERYLGALDGPGLVQKLGPKRIQAILDAVVAQHLQTQGHAAPSRQVEAPVAPPEKAIDSAEVNRRLRAMRLGEKF